MPGIAKSDQAAAARVLRAVEDIDFPLHDVALILTTYTSYLFQKLEGCASANVSKESEIADALFECVDDRSAVDGALNTLGSIRSAIAIQYARNAINGSAHFPPLDGTIFAEGRVPVDPVMNSSAVKTTYGITNTGGWVYQQTTGIVKVNLNAYSSY